MLERWGRREGEGDSLGREIIGNNGISSCWETRIIKENKREVIWEREERVHVLKEREKEKTNQKNKRENKRKKGENKREREEGGHTFFLEEGEREELHSFSV